MYLERVRELVRNAELCGEYSLMSMFEPPRRGRPKLAPKVQWHDLQLDRKYHEGLAAVVILTHKPSGLYWVQHTSDVYTWFARLDQKLRGNQLLEPVRLQRMYNLCQDFHVQLVTCGQWVPGQSAQRRETWLKGLAQAAQIEQVYLCTRSFDRKCLNFYPDLTGVSFEELIRPMAKDYQYQATQAEETSRRKFRI